MPSAPLTHLMSTRSRAAPYPCIPPVSQLLFFPDDQTGHDFEIDCPIPRRFPFPPRRLPLTSSSPPQYHCTSPEPASTPPPRTPLHDRSTLSSPLSSLPSEYSDDKQLVNDHNHVGPGHDFSIRPWICDFEECDKAFARKSDLSRHFRIHTNNRPFACMLRGCGKSFIQRSALTVHTRVHTGEKPHTCGSCLKAFADSSSLARHRRIHTGNRPYVCKVLDCARPFARRTTYLIHYRRQHPAIPPPPTSFAVRSNPRVQPYNTPTSTPLYFSPGPPGADGRPRYFIPTSSSAGRPHAIAASYPPKGAPQPFQGGYHQSYPFQISNEQHFSEPISGSYRQADSQLTPGDNRTSTGVPAARVELGIVQTPTPQGASARPSFFRQHGPPHATTYAYPASSPAYHGIQPPQYTGANLSAPSVQDHPILHLPRRDGPVTSFQSQQRQIARPVVGQPCPPLFRQYLPSHYGDVGGGFSPDQLALPGRQMPLYPSYWQPAPTSSVGAQPPRSSAHYWVSHQQQRQPRGSLSGSSSGVSRELSEEPLVDVISVPSFNVHPPGDPSMTMPFSAVEVHQFNPLTQGPPQITMTPPPGRFNHSHPQLLRSQSMPVIPTTSTPLELFHGPSGYDEARNIGEGRSGESQECESPASDDETVSREASESSDRLLAEHPTAIPVDPPKPPVYWDTPLSYPVPPGHQFQTVNGCPSSASSSSASSTLVTPSFKVTSPLALPLTGYPHIAHPMHMTSINQYASYPPSAPAIDMFWGNQYMMHPALGTPIQLSRPGQIVHTPEQTFPPAAPPGLFRQESGGVTAVGLGIEGVHFQDRSSDIITEEELAPPDPVFEEGEEEIDSDVDIPVEDDSDDEFLPGGKKKAAKKGGRGKASTRGLANRVKRQ